MQRLFIIYYEFSNTAANHAGMAYFARQIRKKLPVRVILIKMPNQLHSYDTKIQKLWRLIIIYFIIIFSNKNDKVFLMEYFGNAAASHQREIAISLRKKGYTKQIFGLVHFPGWHLVDFYGIEYIREGVEALDKVMVYGSSLKSFFSDLGYSNKVLQTFHYVDNIFYKPIPAKGNNKRLKVISLGSLNRDYEELKKIVSSCPEIDFFICMGQKDLNNLFFSYSNVILYGYISENKLLDLMQQADISLSVFNDTIGSNVITTSLACGLVNVVSDVGSVRDYCSNKNSVLCKNTDDFVNALKMLALDRDLIKNLSNNAIQSAEGLTLDRAVNFIKKSFLE